MADNIGNFTSSQPWTPTVTGAATQSNGLEGNTSSDKDSAVYGVHLGNGIGVFGRGGVNAGEGVFGQTNSRSAGVYGKNSAGGSGIVGEGVDGNGIVGFSKNGFAVYADGDVSQAQDKSGFAKALVEISVNGAVAGISRYFVFLPGNPMPTLYRLDAGIYSIDFHFNVKGRYVLATPVALPYTKDGFSTYPEDTYAPFWYPSPSGNTTEGNFTVTNIVFDGLTGPITPALGDPAARVANPTMITVLCYQPASVGAGGANYLTGFQLKDTAVSIAIF